MLRRAVLVVLIATLVAPAAAQGFGLQSQFADDGVNCCGEVVIFNGLALNAGGDVWTSIGPRGTLDRYTTGGAQQASIPMGDVSHGIAVDHVHNVIYGVYGHLHGGYGIKKFGLDGTPLLTFGTTSFTGDFNEGIAVAVNEATQETYGVGAGAGGKIVRFAADGSVLRTILPGVHPQDIEVDQATGNVWVVNYDDSTVVRYDAALDNRTVVYTGTGTHTNPFGLSLTDDGGFWVTWRGDSTAQRIAANGTSKGIVSIAGQVMDVESDDHGGAWVSTGDGHTVRYVGTDPPAASFTASHTGAVSRGTRVDFTSTATDADGTIASTTWDLDGDGTYGDAIGTTAGRTFATAGSFVVRMRVTDNDGATGVASTTVTVVDGAPSPSFTISPAAPRPGDTVTLTSTSADDGTITATDWDLDDDGQLDDGTGSPVTTSFATAGTHHVRIRVMDDAFNQVTLDRAIVIDPDPTELSASDATVTEGNAGSVQLSFHVTLAAPSGHPVTVDYVVDPGTAADGTDFLARSLTSLTFAPGQTSKTINVPVLGDVIDEADETVLLKLSDPDGATLADATGTGTINDDDAAPTVSVQDAQVDEGSGAVAHVTVRLDGPVTERTASVTLATSDGSAHAPGDYTATSQPVTIVPPARSATVDVPIADDDRGETDETVGLTITNTGPLPLGTATATLTIHDADPPDPILALQAPPNPVPEAGPPVSAIVGIPFAQSAPVVLAWQLTGGDTSHSDDWATREGSVTIPAGQTEVTIALQPVGDDTDEEDVEPWVLGVSVASGAARGTLELPVGMTDDDPEAEPVVCPTRCEHENGDPKRAVATVSWPNLNLDLNRNAQVGFDRESEGMSTPAWRRGPGNLQTNICGTVGWQCRVNGYGTGSRFPIGSIYPYPPNGYGGVVDDGPVSTVLQATSGGVAVGYAENSGNIYLLRDAYVQTPLAVTWNLRGQSRNAGLSYRVNHRFASEVLTEAQFDGPSPAYEGDIVSCTGVYAFAEPSRMRRAGPITRGASVVGTGKYVVRSADVGATLHCLSELSGHPTITVARRAEPKGAAGVTTTAPLTVTGGVVAAVPVTCPVVAANCTGTLEYRLATGGGASGGRTARAGAAATKKAKGRRSGTLVGRATFRAKGRKAKVKVKLNKAGRAAFNTTGRLSVIAVVTSGRKVTDRSLVLTAPAPK